MTGGRIYLEGVGGDGGIKKNYREGPDLRAEGGQGAIIGAWFEIGHGTNQIPPGATLLLIIGEKGQDEWAVTASQAGGGGGTGILFQPDPSSGYNLLIVAGGGGGGAADCCLIQIHGKPGEVVQCVYNNGLPYNPYGSETYCYDDQTVYQDRYHCHQAGSLWDDNSDASYFAGSDHYPTPCECSGQMGWPGSQRKKVRDNPVKPTGGGMYGNCDDRASGGFGFGSGAPGKKNIATESSGGGGYTVTSTSGGGSYISPDFSTDEDEELYLERETTRNPEHGRVKYKIIPAPKAVCIDLEVSLPSSGTQAFAYFPMAFGSTTTIPGEGLLVEEVQSQEILTTLDCADIGTQAITLEVIGTISGYGTTCTANLTVKDEVSPALSCKNPTISTDENGNVSFSASDLIDSYSDNCSPTPASLTADHNGFSYDCTSNGQTITEHVKVTATDDSGNSKSCTATISIAVSAADQLPPIVSCKDVSVQLNSQGQGLVYPNQVELSSSDPCGGVISSYQFGQSHLELQVESEGFNADLSWTITSLDGNTVFAERPSYPHNSPSPGINSSETSFQEEITIAPGCYLFNWKDSHGDGFWCFEQPRFYRLTDKDGNVLAYGECDDIGYGQSTQICIEADSFLDELVLDCENIGDHAATLVVTDLSGNTSSCQSIVTVEGGPRAICRPRTVQLNSDGFASLAATSLNNGSYSNCGNITSYQLGQSFLELQVESEGFNADLSWTITSLDGNTVYAERPSYPHNSPSTGINSSETSFHEEITIGPGCYLFNWKDSHGDGFWCFDEPKFYRLTDKDGNVLAYGECDEIGYGQSTEFCVEPENSLNELSFDCDDIGDHIIGLIVTDATGRKSNCQTTITVEAPAMQAVQCTPDLVQIQLDEDGLALLSIEQVLLADFLSCFDNQYSLSKTEFDCQDVGFSEVTLTANHPDGSSSSCEAKIRLRDNIPPTPLCKDITASLGPDGQVTVDAGLADNGSTDHCGIFDLYFDDYRLTRTFDCENVGVEEFYPIMVEDYNGNLAYCDITLTIKNETPPTVGCKDITIQLDENGIAHISEDAINDQSFATCGSLDFDTDITAFNCESLGDNLLTLTVQDQSGNSGTCKAVVTVEDKTAPIALCQNVSIQVDENGLASTTAEAINMGSTDACGIANLSLNQGSFDCAETGTQTVTLTVTDLSGNSSSCEATVTIEDKIIPVALCQNVSVQLNEDGQASISPDILNNGSTDNCGIASLSLSKEHFDCTDIGVQTLLLTVIDASGNPSACEASITIEDKIAPTALCQNISVELDENGQANTSVEAVNNGSTDACGIANLSLSNTDFACADLGEREETLTVVDIHGNIATCQLTITVVDSSPPTITCPEDISVTTDEGECGAYISLPKAAPLDNCGIKNLKSRFREIMPDGTPIGSWSDWASDQSGFFELGLYEIQWRAKDDSNHKAFCSFRLEVSDEEAPEVICKDVTIAFNGEDELAIPSSSIFDAAASFDACGTVSFLSQSLSVIDCDAVGQTVTVEVKGIDPNGNINSCAAKVEITGLPCGLTETNIDCDGETSVIFDPEQETFTLTAEDCTGYPNGEVAFVGQTLCGDGEIRVQVDAVNPNARAGVVMMESTVPGAKRISLVKDLTRRVRTEYRYSTGGSLTYKSKTRSDVAWLRIVRSGNKFKTYTSTNDSYWRLAHSITFPIFESCIELGLITYSKNSRNPATAVFSELEILGENSSYGQAILPPVAMESHSSNNQTGGNLELHASPNPFQEETRIHFSLEQMQAISLSIYDLQGRQIKGLYNGPLEAGDHQWQWNGNDSNGNQLPSGMYLIQLRYADEVVNRRVSYQH